MDYALLYAGFVTTPARQGHADAAQRRLHACLRDEVPWEVAQRTDAEHCRPS